MQAAIKHLHDFRFEFQGKLYSISGGPMSHSLVRKRLIEDGCVVCLGKVGKNPACRGKRTLRRAASNHLPRDRYLACRTLYWLDSDRLDKINRNLAWEKPKFASQKRRTGQMALQFEDEVIPDFHWHDT